MSLSTRVIAGIGAVAVIGAGTLAGSIAYAKDKGQPDEHLATLVVGRTSIHTTPLCYNGGKPLDQAGIADCQAKAKAKGQDKSLPSSDVIASDRIGVGVDKDVADKGWFAFTDGGSQGQAPIAQDLKKVTYSGSLAAASLLSATGTTTVTVVESDQKSNEIFAVWYFTLNQKV